MRADHVEITWDGEKSKWLARIQIGEEVIRRYCAVPRDADEQTLRSALHKVLEDEGYEQDPEQLSVHR